jgi:hypothetical protein
MELYKVKIPLDSIDVITGSTVVSGVTVQTGYVELTKTGDTYVDIFLTSDYDDMGIYTDFANRDIFNLVTTIPTGNTTTYTGSVSTVGQLISINVSSLSTLIVDPNGPYETKIPSGSQDYEMYLPFGCYDISFDHDADDPFYSIVDESTNEILIEGSNSDGTFCIECKTGKLQIATHTVPESGYTGSTAYVMATSDCNTWTVTGTTSNNMMEILPIAGINQLATNVHSQYDANENPIEVTLIYGSVANNTQSGATYNIGTGDTKISYNTTDISSLDTNFSFKRECCEECYGLNTKEEMKMGWVFDPKINVNVFIDRGQNSIFDKFLRLSEVSNNDELLDYNNNYFKVDKQQV